MERGALSYSKAREITRVATLVNADYLLMIAEHGWNVRAHLRLTCVNPNRIPRTRSRSAAGQARTGAPRTLLA
jgi:hypothetical protein